MAAYPKEKQTQREKKVRVKSQNKRKVLMGQLEAIVKQIVFWRDGSLCVEQELDGVRCGNGLTWGHFIGQKSSPWLRYDLGNVFAQCGSHNYLHFHHDETYRRWFLKTFGVGAFDALCEEAASHVGKVPKIHEMEEMLVKYDALYDGHFSVTPTLHELVVNGYYGATILAVWQKEGRFS